GWTSRAPRAGSRPCSASASTVLSAACGCDAYTVDAGERGQGSRVDRFDLFRRITAAMVQHLLINFLTAHPGYHCRACLARRFHSRMEEVRDGLAGGESAATPIT